MGGAVDATIVAAGGCAVASVSALRNGLEALAGSTSADATDVAVLESLCTLR